MSLEDLETQVLAEHLRKRNLTSLFGAVSRLDQAEAIDEDAFRSSVATSLAQGRFRIVLALDAAPAELVWVASYLQLVAKGRITLDLITIASYTVGGTEVLVPQRVDGEPLVSATEGQPVHRTVKKGELTEGSAAFETSIKSAPVDQQPLLRELVEWARTLEQEGLVTLESYRGAERWILLPRLVADGAGLVSIWNERVASLQLWRSMFERRAPTFIGPIEAAIGGPIKQGGYAKTWNAATLDLLRGAYRHAASRINVSDQGAE